nr:50S ribosomal protein L32 [Lactiplantibacillus plantarum]
MAVPARRTYKMRKRNRRGHIKLATPNLAPFPNCGEVRVSHRVCPSCGYYNGKQVVKVNN